MSVAAWLVGESVGDAALGEEVSLSESWLMAFSSRRFDCWISVRSFSVDWCWAFWSSRKLARSVSMDEVGVAGELVRLEVEDISSSRGGELSWELSAILVLCRVALPDIK